MVRAVAAVDAGQVVNPDGLTNRVEGAILQSMSWTLYESVSFDDTRVTSTDWSAYPILRFDAVPDSIDVHIVDRPGSRSSAPPRPDKVPRPALSEMRLRMLPGIACAICR